MEEFGRRAKADEKYLTKMTRGLDRSEHMPAWRDARDDPGLCSNAAGVEDRLTAQTFQRRHQQQHPAQLPAPRHHLAGA